MAAIIAAGLSGAADSASKTFDWEQKSTIHDTESKTAKSETMPRVLILGDSISLGYTPIVVKKLEGTIYVSRPPVNCGPSTFYLNGDTLKKQWLGDGKWDVIHVNFGIWDNHFIRGNELFYDASYPAIDKETDPEKRVQMIREKGFSIRTPEEQYEKNLRTILGICQATGAKVIFATTTPMPGWKKDNRIVRVPAYNEIAKRVCKEMGVAVNDLYETAKPLEKLQWDGCHFREEGYAVLADAVIASIEKNLPEKP